jgi:hypothetical protein
MDLYPALAKTNTGIENCRLYVIKRIGEIGLKGFQEEKFAFAGNANFV